MPEIQETSKQYIVLPEETRLGALSHDQSLSSFIDTSTPEWRLLVYEEEATDEDVLRCAEQSGHFDFLHEPEEDIYGIDDGEPV